MLIDYDVCVYIEMRHAQLSTFVHNNDTKLDILIFTNESYIPVPNGLSTQ